MPTSIRIDVGISPYLNMYFEIEFCGSMILTKKYQYDIM